MFTHTLYTWLLANIIHPFLWLFMPLFMEGGSIGLSEGSVGILMLVTFFSAVISFPCLLMGWRLLRLIAVIDYTRDAKFCIWITAVLSLILAETLLIALCFKEPVSEMVWIVAPISVATVIAICARYSLFIKLITPVQPDSYEKD